MIAVDLSKQQALDSDPRAIQQINFKAELDRDNGATMLFIIEKAKETIFQTFHKEPQKFCKHNLIEYRVQFHFLSI